MNPSTREDFYWLVSDEAKPILRQVQDAFLDQVNAVRIAKSLRKKFSPNRSALIMEQAQLRIRARTKFKLANEMYFTSIQCGSIIKNPSEMDALILIRS